MVERFPSEEEVGEAFSKELQSVLLDPITSIDVDYVQALQRVSKSRYVPATWYALLKSRDWKEVSIVQDALSWRPWSRPYGQPMYEESRREWPEWYGTISELKPFEMTSETKQLLIDFYPGQWNWENPVDRVVGEVYSFLLEHSAVVTAQVSGQFTETPNAG